jgi:hypothetical protein
MRPINYNKNSQVSTAGVEDPLRSAPSYFCLNNVVTAANRVDITVSPHFSHISFSNLQKYLGPLHRHLNCVVWATFQSRLEPSILGIAP